MVACSSGSPLKRMCWHSLAVDWFGAFRDQGDGLPL
jgi:hypothetical protein